MDSPRVYLRSVTYNRSHQFARLALFTIVPFLNIVFPEHLFDFFENCQTINSWDVDIEQKKADRLGSREIIFLLGIICDQLLEIVNCFLPIWHDCKPIEYFIIWKQEFHLFACCELILNINNFTVLVRLVKKPLLFQFFQKLYQFFLFRSHDPI